MERRSRVGADAGAGGLRGIAGEVGERVALVLRRWWENPLLNHARRLHPMPVGALSWALPYAMFGFAALAGLTWAATGVVPAGRIVGAGLTGLSLAAVLLPVTAAAPVCAERTASQLAAVGRDPRGLADLPSGTVVEGLILTGLWPLRWLIVAGIALTPALMLNVVRLDVASFGSWQESAQALGGATPASRAAWLVTGGRIPFFRVGMRALSAGIVPWVALGVCGALGVSIALWVSDPQFATLSALLVGTLGIALLAAGWGELSITPLLAGKLEIVRLALHVALVGGLIFAARRLMVGVGAAIRRMFASPPGPGDRDEQSEGDYGDPA
jgi:hypothetical protein